MNFSKLTELQQRAEHSKVIGVLIALIGSLILAIIGTMISIKLENPIAIILMIIGFVFGIVHLVFVYSFTRKYLYELLLQYGIDKEERVQLCKEIEETCLLRCYYHPDVCEFYKELSANDCDVLEQFLKERNYRIVDIQEGKRVFIDKL